MAEQLTCNQQVVGSIPIASSTYMGRFPSGQREQTVNLSSPDFGGPNPPLPTKNIRNHLWLRIFFVGKGEPRNTARWFVAEQFVRIANADGEVRRTPPLPTFLIADIFLGRGEIRNTARWFAARGNEIKNENVFCFFEQFRLYTVAERLASRTPPLPTPFMVTDIFYGQG